MGEAATGKEMIARRIHCRSHRRDRAFVTIDCSTMNEAALDREMFGTEGKLGMLEVANFGSLFINSIEKMTPAIQNKLMNFPNVITQNDFKDWIQERSIYHAADFGSNYQTLFSMQDPGEGEEVGSLIYTDFGKGRFIYTGLVFFRELPAGVPGAYRLFANLLAKPE